jgi:hypothetical protein
MPHRRPRHREKNLEDLNYERVAKDRESLYGNGTQATRSSRFLYHCGV